MTDYTGQSKVIGYIRQNFNDCSEGDNLQDQILRLQSVGVASIICDFDSSSKRYRKGLKNLITLVKTGKIHTVVATDLERLVRTPEDYLKIHKVFEEKKIDLDLLDEGKFYFPLGGHSLID